MMLHVCTQISYELITEWTAYPLSRYFDTHKGATDEFAVPMFKSPKKSREEKVSVSSGSEEEIVADSLPRDAECSCSNKWVGSFLFCK